MDGRAALYARVSKQHVQTPENQLLKLRDDAHRRGYTVVREYVDRMSGAKESRPALDSLMRDARSHQFDAVIVARFDRFARSTSHLLRALETFKEMGIDFISLNEAIDTSTAMGKFFFTVVGAFAEFERSIIQERIRMGLDRARREGRTLGRPRVLLDVAMIQRLHAEGLGVRKIAKQFGCSASTIQSTLIACKNPADA